MVILMVQVDQMVMLVQPVAEEDRQVRDGMVRVLEELMVGMPDYHLIQVELEVQMWFIVVHWLLTRKVDLAVVLARESTITMNRMLEGVEDTLEVEEEDKF